MALQVTLTDSPVGLAIPAGYARIVQVLADFVQGKVQVAVDVYATAAARQAGKRPVSGGQYLADVTTDPAAKPGINPDASEGIRTNAYAYLKTLPDFAGATDV